MSSASQRGHAKAEMPTMAMRPPSHIILATDFTARCDRAQDRAVQLAVEWNASLTAVHGLSDVTHPDGSARRISKGRDAQRASASRGVGLHRRSPLGRHRRRGARRGRGPGRCGKERAELVLTGIAGTGPLIGSTVTALARTSPLPLMVVKKKVLKTDGRAAVAVTVNSSKPALMVALRWFGFRRLELFHAFDAPYRGLVDDKIAYDSHFEEAAVEHAGISSGTWQA